MHQLSGNHTPAITRSAVIKQISYQTIRLSTIDNAISAPGRAVEPVNCEHRLTIPGPHPVGAKRDCKKEAGQKAVLQRQRNPRGYRNSVENFSDTARQLQILGWRCGQHQKLITGFHRG